MEALSVGCPALITPEPNLGNIVQQNRAGIAVLGNPEQIAQGIKTLVDTTPKNYTSMSENARQLSENRFTWSKVTQSMVHVYGEVMERVGNGQT